MKLAEIVTQLQIVLPKYTDKFNDTVSVVSVNASAGVAIFNSPDHGLITGSPITIFDYAQETPIDSISQDGLIFTLGCPVRHDLTLGYPGYENVTIGGFTDSAWNGDFKLIDVHTRRDFKIQSVETLPTLNGNEYLLEVRVDGINGVYSITVIDKDNFSISGNFEDGDFSVGTIGQSVRIAGSINVDRTIESYTGQDVGDMWAFVSMADAIVSKDRNALSDAVATFGTGQDQRLRLVDGFSIFLIGNCTQESAAVEILDIFRHDLLSPMLKSLYGVKFSSGLANGADFTAILTSHGQVYYDRSILVYQYKFEFSTDITSEDAVENQNNRAFSEVDFTQSVSDNEDASDMTFDPELPD